MTLDLLFWLVNSRTRELNVLGRGPTPPLRPATGEPQQIVKYLQEQSCRVCSSLQACVFRKFSRCCVAKIRSVEKLVFAGSTAAHGLAPVRRTRQRDICTYSLLATSTAERGEKKAKPEGEIIAASDYDVVSKLGCGGRTAAVFILEPDFKVIYIRPSS